jgi:hypothetical protein
MVRVMRGLYRIEGEYHLLVIRFISFGKCQLKPPLLEGAFREDDPRFESFVSIVDSSSDAWLGDEQTCLVIAA